MKQFEINKIYKAKNGLRIMTVKRTDKTLFFKYIDSNTFDRIDKTYRRKIKIENDCENIIIRDAFGAPHVYAKDEYKYLGGLKDACTHESKSH